MMKTKKSNIQAILTSTQDMLSILPYGIRTKVAALLNQPGNVLVTEDLIWLQRMIGELDYIEDNQDREEWLMAIEDKVSILNNTVSEKVMELRGTAIESFYQPEVTILDRKREDRFEMSKYFDSLLNKCKPGLEPLVPKLHGTCNLPATRTSNYTLFKGRFDPRDIDIIWHNCESKSSLETERYTAQIVAKDEVYYCAHRQPLNIVFHDVVGQLVSLDRKDIDFANVLITNDGVGKKVFSSHGKPSSIFAELEESLGEENNKQILKEIENKVIYFEAIKMATARQKMKH